MPDNGVSERLLFSTDSPDTITRRGYTRSVSATGLLSICRYARSVASTCDFYRPRLAIVGCISTGRRLQAMHSGWISPSKVSSLGLPSGQVADDFVRDINPDVSERSAGHAGMRHSH